MSTERQGPWGTRRPGARCFLLSYMSWEANTGAVSRRRGRRGLGRIRIGSNRHSAEHAGPEYPARDILAGANSHVKQGEGSIVRLDFALDFVRLGIWHETKRSTENT